MNARVAELCGLRQFRLVETALADSDATTYRDASEGTTLVWFSDNAPDTGKAPTAVN